MFLWFYNFQNIDVHFITLEGLQQHPIARTSGSMVELLSTYSIVQK